MSLGTWKPATSSSTSVAAAHERDPAAHGRPDHRDERREQDRPQRVPARPGGLKPERSAPPWVWSSGRDSVDLESTSTEVADDPRACARRRPRAAVRGARARRSTTRRASDETSACAGQRHDVRRDVDADVPVRVPQRDDGFDQRGRGAVRRDVLHRVVDRPLVECGERACRDEHSERGERAGECERERVTPGHERAGRGGRSRSGPVWCRPALRRARSAGAPARRP